MPTVLRIAGRDDEIEALLGQLAEVMKGHGRLALVSGEAGIGKTTLVEELQRKAIALGFVPHVGRCLPGIAPPFHPFKEAFRDLRLSFQNMRTEGQALESQHEKVSGDRVFDQPDKEKIFFQALRVVREAAKEKAIFLKLEDLHWSDYASIELLYFLARNIRELPVLIIGTYRTEDLQRAEKEIVHPLVQHVQMLRKAGLVYEIELRQLDPAEMSSVAEGLLGHRVDPYLLQEVFVESHGNPLFLVETIKLLLNNGTIVLTDGTWRSTVTGKLDLPTTVTEVVTRRLERLSREEGRILDCAAVVGERFEPDLVQSCLGLDKNNFSRVLEALRREQQLISPEDDIYKFSHETIKRVTYERISGARRRELHRSIGLLMEQRSKGEARYSELSYHFFHAKEVERGVKYSLLAGDEVLSREGSVEAMQYYQNALDLIPDLSEPTSHLRAEEGLGDAYVFEGDAALAAQHYEKALALSPLGSQRARLLRKMAECWGPLKLGQGSKARALELCAEAQAVPEIDAEEEGEIGSLLIVVALLESDWEEAKRQALLSADAFRRSQNGKKLSLQLLYNSDVFISTGELDRALEMIREAETLNEKLQNPITQSEVDFHYGMVYLHRGQVEKAMPHYDAYVEISEKLGHDSALSIVHFYQALLLDMIGDYRAALEHAQRSREHALRIDSRYHTAGSGAILAHTFYCMKDSAECMRYATEAYEIGSKFDKSLRSPTLGMIFAAAAEAAQVRNDWGEAERLFKEAIAMFDVCAIGKLMKALALTSYGDALFAHENKEESIARIEEASSIFSMLGNEEQLKCCRQALQSIHG